MLTADTNLRYRQNLVTRRIAIVALSTNAWPVIRALRRQLDPTDTSSSKRE